MLIVSVVSAQGKEQGKEVIFSKQNWKEVSALATQTHQYIFVDAYTSWCGPCKQLKETTFRDSSVAAYFNQHFLNFSADMEKGEGLKLSENWKISGYPTLLFFDPTGQLVLMQTGYVNAAVLLALAKEVMKK